MSWVCKSANPISFTCTNIHALQAISHYSLLISQPVKLSKHHSWKNWGRNTLGCQATIPVFNGQVANEVSKNL